MDGTRALRARESLEIRTPNGEIYRIRIGPGGRGVNVAALVVQLQPRRGKKGRPPRPGTATVRERIRQDAEKGVLEPSGEYVRLYRRVDPRASLPIMRQVVQRELRAALVAFPKAKRTPSTRRASPALVALRQRLAHDKKTAGIKDPRHYVTWLLKQDRRLGIRGARAIVYRERRVAMGT